MDVLPEHGNESRRAARNHRDDFDLGQGDVVKRFLINIALIPVALLLICIVIVVVEFILMPPPGWYQ